MKNSTSEEKNNAEEAVKDEYLKFLMTNVVDTGRFGNIKTNLDNNMMCGSDIYPRTKDKNVGLLKNYNASKQATRIAPDTKAVKLMKIGGEKKTRKTKKKGEPHCYHCSGTHYWAYGCPNILEAKREKMRTTKE